jgi:hypothetical protein
MWNEWKRITRFLESARIAFSREQKLWEGLEIHQPNDAKISTTKGLSTYQVSLEEHKNTLADEWILHASVLVYSYALAEAAAANKLGLQASDMAGVEVWGKQILDQAGQQWTSVKGELQGAVEVAVIRNCIAHGMQIFTQTGFNRMKNLGVTPSWGVGDPIPLGYDDLDEYRARIKSLLRNGQI